MRLETVNNWCTVINKYRQHSVYRNLPIFVKLSYETILLDMNEYFLTKNINWYVKKDIMIRLKKKTKLTFVYSLFIL